MAAKYLEFNTEARSRLKRGVDQLANAVKISSGGPPVILIAEEDTFTF